MGWIIIAGLLFIVSIAMVAINDRYWYSDLVSGIFGGTLFVCFLALLIMGCSLINREARFDAFVKEYDSTKALVENYSGTDYGNMQALTEKVLSLNGTIASHKAFVGNKMSGVWYSDRIASLDPIVFANSNTKNLE